MYRKASVMEFKADRGEDLKEGEVYVGVKSTGICGSDCHFVSLFFVMIVVL